jgi:transposase
MKKHIVKLSTQQRRELESIISTGVAPAKRIMHARILLKADTRVGLSDSEIAEAVDASVATVERVRRKFCEGGFGQALDRVQQPPRPNKRKLDGDGEAHLIALACSKPPEGHARWTLKLLADRFVQLEGIDPISDELVRRILKKTSLNHGRRNSGVYHRRQMRHSFAEWKTS